MSAVEPEVTVPPPGPLPPRVLGESSTRRTLGRLTASYGYTVTSILTGVVSIPLFLHFLGRKEFGAWVVASTIAGYSLLLQFGIAQAAANRFAGALHRANQEDAVATLATGFWTNARLALPGAGVALVAYVVTSLVAPELSTLRLCLLATGVFLLDLPFTIIGACAGTAGHVTIRQVAASANLAFRVAAGALVLALGAGATGLVVSQAAVGALFHGAMWVVLRHTLPSISLRPRSRDPRISKAIRANSAGFFAIQLGGTIVLAMDTIVIAVALGSADVTPYAIAQRVLALAAGIVSSTTAVFYPDLVRARATGSVDGLRRVFGRMSLVSAVVGGASAGAALVCVRPAIAQWVGTENLVDSATFWCLVGVFLVQILLSPYDVLLTAASEHRRYGLMSLVEAAVNLGLSVALVGRYGPVAVAGATLFGRVATTGPVLLRRSARLLGTRLAEAMPGPRAVVVPVLLSATVMVGLRHFLGTDRPELVLIGVAGLAVYGVALAAVPLLKLGPRASSDLFNERVRPVFALRRR